MISMRLLFARSSAGKNGFWREFAAIAFLSILSAVAFTWPTLKDPFNTVPFDLVDPIYFIWTLSWPAYAIKNQVPDFWTTNAFGGEPDSLAYTDALVGYLPFGFFGDGLSDAIFRYNIIYVFTFALAFGSGYALARMLGSGAPGALVVAAAFAYAPWRLMQGNHINVLSSGGIALSLGLLISGHGWSLNNGWEVRKRKPRRVFFGWLLAAWQLSLGFAIGIPYAYVLAVIGLVLLVSWIRRGHPRPNRALVIANSLGLIIFLGMAYVLSKPSFRVLENFPQNQRTMADVALFSPTWPSMFMAPSFNHWWGNTAMTTRENLSWANEQTVFPGAVLLVLALLGLFSSAWTRKRRVMLAGGTLAAVLITLGTGGPRAGRLFYEPLFNYAPGWDAMRTPGRVIMWVTLGLSLLAAGYLTQLSGATTEQPKWTASARRRWLPLLLAPALLVAIEGYGQLPNPRVPRAPLALADLPQPILVLPNDPIADYLTMAWSVDGFPRIINGYTYFTPPLVEETREIAKEFPSPASKADFRSRGIKTVVVLQQAPLPPVVYDLRAAANPAP